MVQFWGLGLWLGLWLRSLDDLTGQKILSHKLNNTQIRTITFCFLGHILPISLWIYRYVAGNPLNQLGFQLFRSDVVPPSGSDWTPFS